METGPWCCVVQAGLKPMIFSFQPPGVTVNHLTWLSWLSVGVIKTHRNQFGDKRVKLASISWFTGPLKEVIAETLVRN